MNCINCGAPINPHKENCQYCGTYYSTPKSNIFKNKQIRKKAVYPFFIGAGILIFLLNYVVLFDSLSETELVILTPLWFFLFITGLYGYRAEKLTYDIILGKAEDFRLAYKRWIKSVAESNVLMAFLISFIFFPFAYFKKISPLQTALIGALIWGLLLLIFFKGIFPAL